MLIPMSQFTDISPRLKIHKWYQKNAFNGLIGTDIISQNANITLQITVTSNEGHVVSSCRHLDCLLNSRRPIRSYVWKVVLTMLNNMHCISKYGRWTFTDRSAYGRITPDKPGHLINYLSERDYLFL